MYNVYCSCVKSCTGRRLHQPNVSEDTTVRYYFNGINRKECFSMVKQKQNVTYRLPFLKLFCVLPKMLCKRRYWWWLMFLFLESLLVFPDLSFPLEYWICNYKKYMECRLYVQDRTQSNPDTRQTAVQCLRDGDLPCIENKNKRSQRKACLPLERQPIDGL